MILAKVLSFGHNMRKKENCCNKKCWSIKVIVAFVFVVGLGLKHEVLHRDVILKRPRLRISRGADDDFMKMAP